MTAEASKRTVPESAFRFAAGRVQFQASDVDSKATPFRMVARSGEPITHWFWGQVVHDMAGMKVNGDRIPVDYRHCECEVLGYGDKFDTSEGNLVIEGELVPWRDDDRASEVIHKGQAGVPYEASIFFDPEHGLRIEELSAGTSVEVNGRQVNGPGIVIREWLLRGVAVCAYGADPNTQTALSKGEANEYEVTFHRSQSTMSEDNATPEDDQTPETPTDDQTPTDDADATPADDDQKPEEPAADGDQDQAGGNAGDMTADRAELKRFMDRFGAERGARFYTEAVPYHEALETAFDADAKSHRETVEQLQSDNAKLTDRLASLDTGEEDGASFSSNESGDDAESVPENLQHLGPGLSRYAASLKQPTAN